MPKKRQSIPTLLTLIATTGKLRRSLEALINRFDEQHLELGDRIFVRLLGHVWRNPYGKPYGPDQRKEIEAVAWIDRFGQYLRDLEGLIVNVMLRPDLFLALPWNHYVPHSAEECLRRLRLQESALKRMHAGEASSSKTPSGRAELGSFRNSLRDLVSARGLNYCAGQSGVNRDTIDDVCSGRTENPQRRTVEKLEKFIATELNPQPWK